MTADDLDQHFPLAPIDDHMIHQTPDPIRLMWTSDAQTYERHWMVCHDTEGHAVVAVGGSFYPNLDCAEAYAIVNVDGVHASIRAFRRLGADRMDMHVGPIRPTVVEGLRHWQFTLDNNQWDVDLDVHFYDTTRQVARKPLVTGARDMPGRQPHITAGFESFGEVEGTVRLGSTTVRLDRSTARGARDRHWGTGRAVGGPTMQVGTATLQGGHSGNCFVTLSDIGLWGDRVFYPLGDPRPGAARVIGVDRRCRFEPDTDIFLEGVVDYRFSNGDTRQLHFERLGYQTAYLRTGLYGGTPDGVRHQGLYPGHDLVEGEVLDATQPENRIYLRGLDEHQCRVTDGDQVAVGLFQPVDPDAYRACASGDRGWAFL